MAFNAALAWHRAERTADRPVPDEYSTAAWLRSWRKEAAAEKPDLHLVPARVFEYAAEDLAKGWSATQKRGAGRPRFERYDSRSGGFGVDGSITITQTHIKLPKLGKIRVMPNRRIGAPSGRVPAGSYSYARLVKEHGEWFAVVLLDVPDVEAVPGQPTVGLDWGIRKLATLSDGTKYENPRALEQVAVKAEKARKTIARKQRAEDKRHGGPRKRGERRSSSNRLKRARVVLAGQLKRAADIRSNAIHHATKSIASREGHVAAENLRPKSMTRKRVGKGRAAKAALNARILDAAPGEFLRILTYKLEARGYTVTRRNPAFTSQDCSAPALTPTGVCGARNDPGSSEIYKCATCGSVMDRDVNAAKNILARALSDPEGPPVGRSKKRGDAAVSRGGAKALLRTPAAIREQKKVRHAST